MKRILCVEDSPDQLRIIQAALQGYLVIPVATLSEAEESLQKNDVSLLLLDLNLPDGNGIHFFSKLRSGSLKDIPVFILTGDAEIATKVIAFSLGVEDYLVKPIPPLELRARVESRIQKTEKKQQSSLEFQSADILLNLEQQKAWWVEGPKLSPLDLTSTEFKLLHLFVSGLDKVYSRAQLLDAVWGANVHVLDRTVDSHLSHLRKKLSKSQIRIEAVAGAGYRAVCVREKAA